MDSLEGTMLQLSDVLTFAFSYVVSALALGVLHWLPFAGTEELRDRRICYAMGSSVVVGVPAVAMLLSDALAKPHSGTFWAALIVTNLFVSGLAVQVCYWIDDRHAKPISMDEIYDAAKMRD